MKKVVVFLCVLVTACLHAQSEQQHQFLGKHFIASYTECDPEALQNVQALIQAMHEGAARSGAKILSNSFYVFPGNGLTMAILLSESHATIHTYPEHRACFVDLFTCGDHCHSEPFDQVLRAYLKPQGASSKVLIRSETMRESVNE